MLLQSNNVGIEIAQLGQGAGQVGHVHVDTSDLRVMMGGMRTMRGQGLSAGTALLGIRARPWVTGFANAAMRAGSAQPTMKHIAWRARARAAAASTWKAEVLIKQASERKSME
eukprot:10595043-Alexandrium_andersonii.AAC.1